MDLFRDYGMDEIDYYGKVTRDGKNITVTIYGRTPVVFTETDIETIAAFVEKTKGLTK